MTMCFVVVGLRTVFSGLVMRWDPSSGLVPPVLGAIKILVIPAALVVVATELDFMDHGLQTQPRDGLQWLACLGLAVILPIVVEIDKWLQRRHLPAPAAPTPVEVVNPGRAVTPVAAWQTTPPGVAPCGRKQRHDCRREQSSRQGDTMSASQPSEAVGAASGGRLEMDVEQSGFGWLVFAGTVLGLAGLMRVIDAIWAFGYKGSLPDNLQDGVLGSNVKNYAWTFLIVGIILLVASVLLLARSQFARWVGFIAAAIGAVTAITWMPYYPVWSLMYVALAVLVFYALVRHGGREPV
jgi:hypothetical protein